MQYRTLGRTGLQVSTLSLGTMNFGAVGRTGQDEATAADTVLPPDVLDALDEIVAPGVDLSPEEENDPRSSLTDASLRRR